jgi:hypothetical protein
VAAVAIFASHSASADSSGCGLGSMLFDGNKGIAPSVVAVTTNGTSGNQTFGISSGTLGCDQNNTVNSNNGRLFSFADKNLNELASDTSRGEVANYERREVGRRNSERRGNFKQFAGLLFCKKVMKSFGGDIRFRSVQGGFAEFVLRFDVGK